MLEQGLGNGWSRNIQDNAAMKPLTRRECRDIWYAAAKACERLGNTDGARHARFAARCVSADFRNRHDL
jgi:hypothetical protein